jgi:hypothetical protein
MLGGCKSVEPHMQQRWAEPTGDNNGVEVTRTRASGPRPAHSNQTPPARLQPHPRPHHLHRHHRETHLLNRLLTRKIVAHVTMPFAFALTMQTMVCAG